MLHLPLVSSLSSGINNQININKGIWWRLLGSYLAFNDSFSFPRLLQPKPSPSFLIKTCREPPQHCLDKLNGLGLRGLKDSYGEDEFSVEAHRNKPHLLELVIPYKQLHGHITMILLLPPRSATQHFLMASSLAPPSPVLPLCCGPMTMLTLC